MKTWLTVAESAEYAGVSRDTIYTACERRELDHARIGGRRSIRIKPQWIDAWLERHRPRPTQFVEIRPLGIKEMEVIPYALDSSYRG